MSRLQMRCPAPPASGNQDNEVQFRENSSLAIADETPDFAAAYVAKRCSLPMRVAALFVRLPEGMLS
jgi:hypothetical protein